MLLARKVQRRNRLYHTQYWLTQEEWMNHGIHPLRANLQGLITSIFQRNSNESIPENHYYQQRLYNCLRCRLRLANYLYDGVRLFHVLVFHECKKFV